MIRILPPFILKHKQLSKQLFKAATLAIVLILCSNITSTAQQLTGQWIGKFKSEGDPGSTGTDYVLEIEANGNQLSGYSYTYFSIAGKRYFVICRLKGNYDKGSKSMVISEVETVKTNTPPDFENCHQTHQLTYLKQKEKEILIGKWKPTEKGSTCGNGSTELERKALIKENVKKDTESRVTPKKTTPVAKKTPTQTNNNSKKNIPNNIPPVASTKDVKKQEDIPASNLPKVAQQSVKDFQTEKKNSDKTAIPAETVKAKNIPDNTKEKLSKRTYQVIKTIEVSEPNIKVDIYDNGQVDGDVVSIYLNEKQIISSKMLTAQPITLQIKMDENEDVYDLIMYAESLGSIPPNTALMIVTTPTKRFEINISSNEQTSGAIRFKYKK